MLIAAAQTAGPWVLVFPGFAAWWLMYWVYWTLSWELNVDGSTLRWRGLLRHGTVAIDDITRVRLVPNPFRRYGWAGFNNGQMAIRFTVRGWTEITVLSYPALAEFVVGLLPKARRMDDWLS